MLIIKNKKTGELTEISILKGVQDITKDIFLDSHFTDYKMEELSDGYSNGEEVFILSQEDFEWWVEYFKFLEDYEYELDELACKYGYCNSYEPKIPDDFLVIIEEMQVMYDMDNYNVHKNFYKAVIKEIKESFEKENSTN